MSAPQSIPATEEPAAPTPEKKCCSEKCAKCLRDLKDKCCGCTAGCLGKILACGSNVFKALQNPVVAINVLLGAASVTSLLVGYIKYEKRFLADKSDLTIVGSVVGIGALLTADCFLSRKYYKKFDKTD